MRDKKETRAVLDANRTWLPEKPTPITEAMTYEEGVDDALRWVLGDTDDEPAA